MRAVDNSTARIIDTYKTLGIWNETLIIYSTDSKELISRHEEVSSRHEEVSDYFSLRRPRKPLSQNISAPICVSLGFILTCS